MNRLIASGLVLALATSGALAQATGPGASPPMGLTAPPPGSPGGMGTSAMMDDGGPPPRPPGGPHGMRPPPSKAAHLHIEHGDMALDIKCPEEEPLKACADLIIPLLDKLQAMPTAAMPKP